MKRSEDNPWLHRFAVLTALSTLVLIAIGGLVTSHGAGMAVPDWPTTYGYNMFFFPYSQWIGGIFYEHSHRLFASFVGLLTTILAAWLWGKESRAWLRWLGLLAFVLVVVQGVLGGLRVTLFKDQIGIVHATLAQMFLVLVSLIALFASRWWLRLRPRNPAPVPAGFAMTLIAANFLIFAQLVLGASMRHQHAGLAVPDFPLAYGKVWPPTDEASLLGINQRRTDARDFKPITAAQIHLHMAHRVGAVLAVGAVIAAVFGAVRHFRSETGVRRLSAVWLGLIAIQAGLGIATVLSNKAADIATAHVVGGATSLVCGVYLVVITFRLTERTVTFDTAESVRSRRSVVDASPAERPA